LLVEIGCEEIPAQFLDEAREGFGKALREALAQARLLPEATPLETYSTPRRLVARLPQVFEAQPDQVEEVLGPPVRVAFDAQGKPTRAAESFAEKNSARVRQLVRTRTEKGEYVALRRTLRGSSAREILAPLLPTVIAGMSLPKSMYWAGKIGPRFVRPVRWILAILGQGKKARVVPFEFVGVKASSFTLGHRAFGNCAIRVRSFNEYSRRLLKQHVVLEPKKRLEIIREKSKVLLEGLKFRLVTDPELERWIVNSTEWPKPLLGRFEARFLHLPREILVTVMRDHQKYFAVEDWKRNLQPCFITVLNLDRDPKGLIRQGHERVLAARFRDAEFFWQADQRVPLRDRREALAGVTYQAQLGSYAQKVDRMRALGKEVCGLLQTRQAGFSGDQIALLERAIELSKCDLLTQMVHEFPELQGIVGGLYAREQGETAEVAEAIYDHYLPRGTEDSCPRSKLGALVSIADKVDSVVGGFAVGLEPTGSSDPFALRRQANGIIKVLIELSLPIPLRSLVARAISQLNVPWTKPQVDIFRALIEFLEERLRYYLESVERLRYDTVRAVLSAGWDVPIEVARRGAALEKIRDSNDFLALTIAAKRMKNILAKSASADDWSRGEVDPVLLQAREERELFERFQALSVSVEALRQAQDFRGALGAMAKVREPVDRFFDKVLVMSEDRAVRENRLRLVGKLDELFSRLARFSEIAPPAEHVDASTSKAAKPRRT
jgi:glycyl-tRNA synthetase beta chain